MRELDSVDKTEHKSTWPEQFIARSLVMFIVQYM